MTVSALAAPLVGTRTRGVVVVQYAAVAAFVVAVFCPYLIGQAVSPVIFGAVVLWLFVVAELLRRGSGPIAFASVALPVVLLTIAYALNTLPEVTKVALGELPDAFGQFAVELPIAAVAGVLLPRSGRVGGAGTVVRVVAAGSALAAVIERRTGRQFFPGNVVNTNFGFTQQVQGAALSDDGALRGIVAADHPLVLALLLATTVAVVLARPPRPALFVEIGVLLAGIWATDSSGPLAVAVLAVGVRIVAWIAERVGLRIAPSRATARVLFSVGIGALLLAATFFWHPVIDPGVLDQSTLYRFALYSFIPVAIAAMPLGFGLSGPPRGLFVVESPGHPLDIAATVDSEFVLMVLRFGVVGLMVFLAIAWIAVRALLDRTVLRRGGGALAVMTGCGAIVAIEVWPTVSAAWVLLVAFTVSLLFAAHRSSTVETP